jgi:hypothetical protein
MLHFLKLQRYDFYVKVALINLVTGALSLVVVELNRFAERFQ